MTQNSDQIRERKGGLPLVVVSLYTTPHARLADPYCDILLVGDSVGMTMYGLDSTMAVTLDMMIQHTAAVVRGASEALVVADMPAHTYDTRKDALANARRMLAETGAGAVKLEGGGAIKDIIAHLVAHNVPVMGHIGLLPQHIDRFGGYRYQGRNAAEAAALMADAKAIAEAGVFAMVIEAVAEDVAANITRAIPVPTIGIGASPHCDGQVLVLDDLLGLTAKTPRFVKEYADQRSAIAKAVSRYAEEVRARRFPQVSHCYPAGSKD